MLCSSGSPSPSRAPTDSWAPQGTGEPLSFPGQPPAEPRGARAGPLLAWSTGHERGPQAQNTQSRWSVCPPTSPFSPPALCALTVAFRDTLVCLPRAAAPPQKSPRENPCQAGSSVDFTRFQKPGQSTGL